MKIICAFKDENTYALLRNISDVSLYNVHGNMIERNKARKFMKHWGATTLPFAMAFENNVPVMYFYSECSDTVEMDIIDYLKENQSKLIFVK